MISVLLPVCQRHLVYLYDSIQSILNQTFQDWELIILGDNVNVLNYRYLDTRIKPYNLYNNENLGKDRTYNRGLPYAKGDFIAFQDADDISVPHRLELSMEEFNDGYDIVMGDGICLLNGMQRRYVRADQRQFHAPFDTFAIRKDKMIKFQEQPHSGHRIWELDLLIAHPDLKIKCIHMPLVQFRYYSSSIQIYKKKFLIKKLHRWWLRREARPKIRKRLQILRERGHEIR